MEANAAKQLEDPLSMKGDKAWRLNQDDPKEMYLVKFD